MTNRELRWTGDSKGRQGKRGEEMTEEKGMKEVYYSEKISLERTTAIPSLFMNFSNADRHA